MKLIICDAKVDQVHVITRYRKLEHWKALIEENKTYALYNCHVFDNDIAFNPFKVVFGCGTKVQKDDKITYVLTHEFRFKSFKEIQDGKFKTDVLYEIIGLLQEIVKTTSIRTGKKPCTNIVLKDKKVLFFNLSTSDGKILYKFDNDMKDVFPYAVGIWLM
ncbi:hypothetical protein MTR_6g011130 [Medicago truncatula]|uniref:DUF223 domain protein n=1 Tax=Medicago truncatula TaxID=3880 RepID=A0A072U5L3_MEDTR|nr:hypothetical protein MTR_6g011130 [Medicago truncatula]